MAIFLTKDILHEDFINISLYSRFLCKPFWLHFLSVIKNKYITSFSNNRKNIVKRRIFVLKSMWAMLISFVNFYFYTVIMKTEYDSNLSIF